MIEYRPIKGSDIPRIIALFSEFLSTGQPISDSIRALWKQGLYKGYAAVEDGEMLGFMTVSSGIAFTYPHPELEAELAGIVQGETVAYCDALLVLPGHRNRGVAHELASRCRGMLRRRNVAYLLVEIWIYPDGRIPGKPVYDTIGKLVWQKRIDGFYKDMERYGMSCPICGRNCVCGAWVELLQIEYPEKKRAADK